MYYIASVVSLPRHRPFKYVFSLPPISHLYNFDIILIAEIGLSFAFRNFSLTDKLFIYSAYYRLIDRSIDSRLIDRMTDRWMDGWIDSRLIN